MAENGVLTNPPPLTWATEINDSITKFVNATIAADERGGLVAIATTKGVNLAVVQRTGKNSEIVAYIGKTWGEPLDAGVQWRQRW